MIYKYNVVRSARKSIAVVISAENQITVRCGWEVRPETIEKFLDSKSDWIEKVVLQNSTKLAVNDDVIELKSIYVNGKKVPLTFCDKNSISADGVFVKNKKDICRLYINAFLTRSKAASKLWRKRRSFIPQIFRLKIISDAGGVATRKII